MFWFALVFILVFSGNVDAAKLTLSWSDQSSNETEFRVYRKDPINLNYSLIVTLPLNTQIYVDTTVSPNIFYTYQVTAANSVGESLPSNEASNTFILLAVAGMPPIQVNSTEVSVNPSLVLSLGFNDGSGSVAINLSGSPNGILNGPTWTSSGKYGQALNFDGVNDRVELGNFSVSGSAITLMAWVRSGNFSNCGSNQCRIISRASGTAEQAHDFMLSTTLVNNATRLRFRIKTDGITNTLIASSGPLSLNTWQHVAAVYDGSTMRLYLNGVQVGSRLKTGVLTITSGLQTWIGANPPVAALPWNGQLDEFKIFNRALSVTEIQSEMILPVL